MSPRRVGQADDLDYALFARNAFVESFNGKFRDECLNTNCVVRQADAAERIEVWRQDYNGHPPHSSLGDLTPQRSSRGGRLETGEFSESAALSRASGQWLAEVPLDGI